MTAVATAAQTAAATAATSPAAAAATAVPKTLKIGIAASLTGPQVNLGLNYDRFTRFAIDDVNAKGGVKVGGDTYRLEAVTADDSSGSEGARAAANRLALQDKLRFIIGGNFPQGMQSVTEPAKALLLALTAPDQSLGPSNPLTFNNQPLPSMRWQAIYGWERKTYPQMTKIALLNAGSPYHDAIVKAAKDNGFVFVDEQVYPDDLKDFTSMIAHSMRLGPEGFDLETGSRAASLIAASKALIEAGFKGPAFAISADLTALKAQPLEGYTLTWLADWRAGIVTNMEKSLYQRYVNQFGEADLATAGIYGYNAVTVLAQALEKAGTVDDAAKVAQTLRDNEWTTIWSEKYGKARFGGGKTWGLPVVLDQPIYLSGIRNGQIVTFDAFKTVVP